MNGLELYDQVTVNLHERHGRLARGIVIALDTRLHREDDATEYEGKRFVVRVSQEAKGDRAVAYAREGFDWARGWDTPAAHALQVALALT